MVPFLPPHGASAPVMARVVAQFEASLSEVNVSDDTGIDRLYLGSGRHLTQTVDSGGVVRI